MSEAVKQGRRSGKTESTAARDPWATDTADPARIFREMFPSPAPLPDWRLFVVGDDLTTRGVMERVRSQ